MVRHIVEKVKNQVRGKNIRIVYTEPNDDRVLEGAYKVSVQKLAKPILVGDESQIKKRLQGKKLSPRAFDIIDPKTSPKFEEYANAYYELRKSKGMTEAEAKKLISRSNFFGTMMLQNGDADALISGASYTTAETLIPAFQIIKTRPGINLASSFFLMVLKEEAYLFADCSFVRYPTAEELSEIAVSTVHSAQMFGLKPRVAMLSFSTKGSGWGESVDKVREATALAKKKLPGVIVDGEIQLDSAIVPYVAHLKCPTSPLKGKANVFIFPNLDAGNISYKLVERLAKAKALGPISQGLRKPLNVLSRGCSVQDVIDVSAITAMIAINEAKGTPHFKSEKHLVKKGK